MKKTVQFRVKKQHITSADKGPSDSSLTASTKILDKKLMLRKSIKVEEYIEWK